MWSLKKTYKENQLVICGWDGLLNEVRTMVHYRVIRADSDT